MAERESLESIGESLLSQQRERRDRADRRRRKDQKKLMILGTLVAGQSLVNSALKRRMTEIKESNKLNMINSKLYHKKIQTAAQLYSTLDEYGIKTSEDAYANDDFMKAWKIAYQPIIDKQMKLEGLDQTLSPVDANNFINVQQDNTLKTLLDNRNEWNKGVEQFGLTNQQLALGSEADLNVQLTKRSKQSQQDLRGSIFDFPNIKSILTLGRRREGSVYDSTNTADFNPLEGLSSAVTKIGLDKNFAESSRNFKNTSIQWVGKITKPEAENMANAFKDLPRAFETDDRILAGMPKAFSELPRKGWFERRQGADRMQEFIDYVEDEDNALFKQRYTDNANAFYTKLQNQRGFKAEFLTDILQLDPNSEQYRATEAILNDEVGLRFLSHMYTIQQTVIDNKGKSTSTGVFSGKEDFEIDTRAFDSLVRPKIIVGKDKFKTTEAFRESTDEGQVNAVVDQGETILNSELPATTKSTLINRLIEDIPLQIPKDEVRQLIANQQLLGRNQQQATRMNTARIEQLKRDIENKVVTTVDFTGKRKTRPASPRDIANMESQIRRFSEFDLGRLQDPAQGRELRDQMDRLDIQIQSLQDRLPRLKQNLPQDRYDAQLENLEELKQEREGLEQQLNNSQAEDQKKNLVELDPSINVEYVTPVIEWSFSSGRLNQPMEKANLVTNQLLQAIIEVESDFNYDAINPTAKSTAVGAGQFLKDSLVTAVNRANNIREKNNLPPLEQTQAILDNNTRINKLIADRRNVLENQGIDEDTIQIELQKIAKREFQSKDSIARQLSPEVQQELILANLFEANGSDAYFERLLDAKTPQERYEAALDLYLDIHHTDRTDEDTVKRARKLFKPYFLN